MTHEGKGGTAAEAGERPITNSTTIGHYDGAELGRNAGLMPGRFTAYDLPSRMGRKLYYPDGRVEEVK